MNILDIIAPYRNRYVEFYRDRLLKLKSEHSDCVPEVMVQPNGAQNPAPYSLLRLDAVYGGATRPSAVRFVMEPEMVEGGGDSTFADRVIPVGRVSWENVSFSFFSPRFEMEHLGTWLSSWLDEHDKRKTDEAGLAAVVHSIAWDSDQKGKWTITIDFGSAPVEALGELLYLLIDDCVEDLVLDTVSEMPKRQSEPTATRDRGSL